MPDPRILVFAYACEPGKGSEPGAGWEWARILARLGKTWVITRANNQQTIEEALGAIPERERLRFAYVDLPAWARWWKRGNSGARLYFMLWQLGALRQARSLQREVKFDLVWHLTFANAWLGSVGSLVGPRFVLGPVGGGVGVPWRFLRSLGLRGVLFELARGAGRSLFRFLNPLARLSWRRAILILTQNQETSEWLPRKYSGKAVVFPNPVIEPGPPARSKGSRSAKSPTIAYAGRLVPLKGLDMVVRALVDLRGWRLLLVGEGPDKGRLSRLATRLRVADRVRFLPWRSRGELWPLLVEEADVFVFPSLHDEAPWVVSEALAAGLPVVCLDRGGPRSLGGVAVPATNPEEVAKKMADVVSRLARSRPALPPTPTSSYTEARLRRLLASRGLVEPTDEAAIRG
jgi:glycosyltransferase involved in cell wall biosynthesis